MTPSRVNKKVSQSVNLRPSLASKFSTLSYRYLKRLLCVLFRVLFIGGIALPATSYAQDLLIVDQNNLPVTNAIVTLPTPAILDNSAKLAIMDQVNKAFQPHVLLIQRGQRVLFPNKDDIRHHVYSFSSAKTFELKLYKGTPSEPIRFNKEGLVVLGCNIHDSMVGYIYVSDDQLTLQSDTHGKVNIGEYNAKEVLIWHPRQSGLAEIQQRQTVTLQSTSNGLKATIQLKPPTDDSGNTLERKFKKFK
jgi:plastocyanin